MSKISLVGFLSVGLFLDAFPDPLKNGSGIFFMIVGVPKWAQKDGFVLVLGGSWCTLGAKVSFRT